MIIFMSGFLHESTGPVPLSKSLKYFRKYFCFRREIHENISNVRATIPRSLKPGLRLPHFLLSNHNPMYVCTTSQQLIFVLAPFRVLFIGNRPIFR